MGSTGAFRTGHFICYKHRTHVVPPAPPRKLLLLSAQQLDYGEFSRQEIGGNTLKIYSMVAQSMFVVLFAVAVVCSAAAAQPLPGAGTALERQEVDGVDLDDLLARAAGSARRYAEVIQDLTTEETTTILTYDDEDRVTGRRVFVSQLMVHRLTHSPGEIEYRHVLSVDGREAGDRELRVQALARELANASSESEERELIARESRKFGLAARNVGRTLTSSFVRSSVGDRETFEWAIAGRETIDGMDFILVDYRQISTTPFRLGIVGRFVGLPDTARNYFRGRLWLEASTGDLWRDEGGWFMEGLPELSEDPIGVEYEYQYAPSSYGIFTPERFEFTPRYRIRPLLQGDFSPVERRIQEFAPFERFDEFFLEEPVQ